MRSSAVIIGQDAEASQYNNLRLDAQAASYLLAHEQSTPDLTLYVEAGVFQVGETKVSFAGGSSPSFTAPSGNPRIDLLVINSSGTLSRVAGSEAASPVAPDYPADKLVIAEVYNRVGQSSVKDADDSSNGYIYKDARPYLVKDNYLIGQDGSPIYAADAGGSDAYAITLDPAPTAYTTGMVVNFKANTANTGAATLNVNSLGAKTIKKQHDADLDTGDIESGQIITVVYDGTNFQMQSQVASAPASNNYTMTAGEDIAGLTSGPFPLAIAKDLSSAESLRAQNASTGANYDIYGVRWAGQSFTAEEFNEVTKIELYGNRGGDAGTCYLDIYAAGSDGKPTGSPLGSQSFAATLFGGSPAWVTITFSSAVLLTGGYQNKYVYVLRAPSGDASNFLRPNYYTSDIYSGGEKLLSTNGGSSWSIASTEDWSFKLYGQFTNQTTTGRVYKADADDVEKIRLVGFGISDATTGNGISVQIQGVVTGLSSLTVGELYYVQNDGSLGTSAGTNTILVGRAISATELLILKDAPIA